MAAISDALLPVVRPTRKTVFIRRLSVDDSIVSNSGDASMVSTLLRSHEGIIRCCGGFRINWERARRENSRSFVLILKP